MKKTIIIAVIAIFGQILNAQKISEIKDWNPLTKSISSKNEEIKTGSKVPLICTHKRWEFRR